MTRLSALLKPKAACPPESKVEDERHARELCPRTA